MTRGRRVRGDGLRGARARAAARRPPAGARGLHHRQRRGPPRPRGRPRAGRRRLLPGPPPRHLRDLRGAAARGAPARPSSSTSRATCGCPTAEAYARGTATTIPAPALLGQAPYGLTEVYRERLRGARLVSNPGCYATSALLPLVPLSSEGSSTPTTWWWTPRAAPPAPAARCARTCSSARSPDDFSAYAPGRAHRHVGEIEAVLARARPGRACALTFCPHLLPVKRGILSALYLQTDGRRHGAVRRRSRTLLRGSPFVRVVDGAAPPLRRGAHERLPHLRARGGARARRRVLGARQPGQGRGGPGHPEPEPGDGLARRARACRRGARRA